MTASHSASSLLRANRPAVNGWSAEYLDDQYKQYLANPASVPADMQQFFAGFDLAAASGNGNATRAGGSGDDTQRKADALVRGYRDLGHLAADIDPFHRPRTGVAGAAPRPDKLDAKKIGLTESEMGKTVASPFGSMTVRDLIAKLEATYCGSIGLEFMHSPDEAERAWFQQKVESAEFLAPVSQRERMMILEQITAAEQFDKFLGVRYQGKKRFSLEGGDALIPLLKALAQRAGEHGTGEIIMGMPHRGRLSVLCNFLGKDSQKLFTEFEDAWQMGTQVSVTGAAGDVKYHRGYSGDQDVLDEKGKKIGTVHLSMLNNPSHLESVDPVVMGKARAKQDLLGDVSKTRVISLMLHGDAAVIGQGVVAECLNMSKLPGYDVGGTIHVVVNNQVGFTTDPEDGRSTAYCTDVGKIVNAPAIHVNGDDPEAVVRAAKLAIDYRQQFKRDVFIDLVCFRRHGHNEADEPRYTQPQLYKYVSDDKGPAHNYRERLAAAGLVSAEQSQTVVERIFADLDAGQSKARAQPVNPVPPPGGGQWDGFTGEYTFDSPKTAVDPQTIARVCSAMGTAPEGFNVNAKLKQMLAARAGLPTSKKLSHADAEQIAIGTLLLDNIPVRLSGQDCRRGTFTQRHAVLRDEQTGKRVTLLNHIVPEGKQAKFDVWDSPLSEYSVMGFDYGYSRGRPKSLVMWEGQFGDFANGAQIMIDQWLASSETKWARWGGLVLLLPHGYEGQGPEHSSARLERFLQLCADDNMEVCYPSTAAQTFHMLRRQALRNIRKPLIVMTPKKYLRIETSSVDELSMGGFQHLIDDSAVDAKSVKQVIYCSGKIYHELKERREATGRSDIAIVRLEQLFPLHVDLAKKIDSRYPASAKRVWVQEEHRNAGAWLYVVDAFRESLGINLSYIGRKPSASPAIGSEKGHGKEQIALLDAAIAPLPAGASGKTDDKSKPAAAGKK
ncbi:MAG TPA: 2-oxoglutarate dehydrogenase E1 component [Phycisphaerales bacterium]|nr:2-oxoglutarate dehydrogenase E1 component [Phycisphaerales bacterium]